MLKSTFVFALAALVLSGCMIPQPPTLQPLPPADLPIAATPDRVWNALIEAYTDLSIPIENMDRASWFLRSGDFTIAGPLNGHPSTFYFDCGREMGMARAEMYRLTAQFTTLLRPGATEGQTGVRTQANATPNSDNAFTVPCVSTGKFEEMVAEMLRERI